MKLISQQEADAAQATHDRYLKLDEKGRYDRKESDRYTRACRILNYFHAQRECKTSHELAKFLLAQPEMPVIGHAVGQGSNEQGDDHLWTFEVQEYGGEKAIVLDFGGGPLTMDFPQPLNAAETFNSVAGSCPDLPEVPPHTTPDIPRDP